MLLDPSIIGVSDRVTAVAKIITKVHGISLNFHANMSGSESSIFFWRALSFISTYTEPYSAGGKSSICQQENSEGQKNCMDFSKLKGDFLRYS